MRRESISNGALAEALFALADSEPPDDRRLALLRAGYTAFDSPDTAHHEILRDAPNWLRPLISQLVGCHGEDALQAAVQRLQGGENSRRRPARHGYLSRAEMTETLRSGPEDLHPQLAHPRFRRQGGPRGHGPCVRTARLRLVDGHRPLAWARGRIRSRSRGCSSTATAGRAMEWPARRRPPSIPGTRGGGPRRRHARRSSRGAARGRLRGGRGAQLLRPRPRSDRASRACR